MDLEIKNVITIYILAQKAENTPPLGTVLGNLGVNAIKFCTELMNLQKVYLNILLVQLQFLFLKINHLNLKLNSLL